MSKEPLVSIIMNCFNGEQYIKQAIDSIYAQTYSNWEVIFWDNASTDQSYNIASSYDSKIIKFRCETNISLGAARQRAIEHAKGEWLAFLDVDDIWLPEKLKLQMAGLVESDYLISYGGIKEVDKDLNLIRELPPKWETGSQLKSQLLYFEINLVTSMVNRHKLMQLGLNFDPEMQASEEYNLYMRLLPHGSVYVCQDIIALYRVYSESLTYEKIDRLAEERRITLNELALSIPLLKEENEFKIAKRQSDYYEACSHMSRKNFAAARRLMWRHASSPVFTALFALSFFPAIWNFCHNPTVKKKLTGIMRLH